MGKINITDYFHPANPSIPSTYEQAFTEFETLCKLITYVNSLYDQYVAVMGVENILTESYNTLNLTVTNYKNLMDEFLKGDTIPEHSVSLDKLSSGIMEQLQQWVSEYMYNMHNFVSFGLENGRFVAYIPQTWKDIVFSTDVEGHLILEF